MTEDDVQINSLEKLVYYLERWLTAYENGQPLVSDDCYDHYKRALELYDPDNQFLKKIGNKPKKNKQKLPYILGSLKNKTIDDIDQWLEKYKEDSIGYILSHKLDGVAIECEYTLQSEMNYSLTNAWLRGDHIVGENIIHKAIKFTPLTVNIPIGDETKHYFKGEMLLKCEPGSLGYKNKRNAVAGIINRDDSSLLDNIYVLFHTWVTYGSYHYELGRLKLMSSKFFPKNTVRFHYVKTKDEILTAAKSLIAETTQYDKDGIVITINNSIHENIKLPEKKIAFKFNKQTAETKVDHIEWNTSRTGKIVPLIYINPVDLGGATISKCAGFNARFIIDNAIGKGSKIKIVRSGDVIPYIEEIIEGVELIELPAQCPSCETDISWDETTVNIICENPNCPPQVQKKIAHFFEQLGLEQFSEKMITSLGCESITEVLNISKNDILLIEGWAEKSANDFLKRIQEIKTVSPEKLLAALSIENLGNTSARLLLNNFTFEEILTGVYPEVKTEFVTKMVQIKGLGEKKVKSIIVGLVENIPLLRQLQEAGIILETEKEGPLKNLSFCITGSLSRPRKDIEKWIEDKGGVNTGIGSCNYLVCNEISDSSKYKKAVERKIPIITEEQLEGMIR